MHNVLFQFISSQFDLYITSKKKVSEEEVLYKKPPAA